ELTTKLCLLLSLAPHHRPRSYGDPPTPAPFPPPTTPGPRRPPAPQEPPQPTAPPALAPREHQNSHPKPTPGKEGTEEKTLALQPPPGKRSRGDAPGPAPGPGQPPEQGPSESDPKDPADPDRDPDPENPEDPEDPEGPAAPEDPPVAGASGGGEGEVEGHPHTHPPPVPTNGHNGEVGPENGEPEPFLTGLASRLTRWDLQYKQLVDDILEDLEGYWQKLAILQ
ncbi:E4 protein, partial [human papillomavirus 76]